MTNPENATVPENSFALEREQLLEELNQMRRERRAQDQLMERLLSSETEVIQILQAHHNEFLISPEEKRIKITEFANTGLRFSCGKYLAREEVLAGFNMSFASARHPLEQAEPTQLRYLLVHDNGRFILISRISENAYRFHTIQAGARIDCKRLDYGADGEPQWLQLQASKDYIREFIALVNGALPKEEAFAN